MSNIDMGSMFDQALEVASDLFPLIALALAFVLAYVLIRFILYQMHEMRG